MTDAEESWVFVQAEDGSRVARSRAGSTANQSVGAGPGGGLTPPGLAAIADAHAGNAGAGGLTPTTRERLITVEGLPLAEPTLTFRVAEADCPRMDDLKRLIVWYINAGCETVGIEPGPYVPKQDWGFHSVARAIPFNMPLSALEATDFPCDSIGTAGQHPGWLTTAISETFGCCGLTRHFSGTLSHQLWSDPARGFEGLQLT